MLATADVEPLRRTACEAAIAAESEADATRRIFEEYLWFVSL